VKSSGTNEYAGSDLNDVLHVVDGIQRKHSFIKFTRNSEVESQLGEARRRVEKAVKKFQVSRSKFSHHKSALIRAFRRSSQYSSP
jgi:hypothetical protein